MCEPNRAKAHSNWPDQLDAPVALKRGTIGRFSVQFGFASFTSASLKVELEDIDIVFAPLSPKEVLRR